MLMQMIRPAALCRLPVEPSPNLTQDVHPLRKKLSWWKRFLLAQKYRFDLGQQFLTLINLTLLIVAASDKLRYYTNISRTWILIMVMVPLGFLGVWLFGFFLDHVVKYSQAYNLEISKRNPLLEEQKIQMDRIEKYLSDIRDRIK